MNEPVDHPSAKQLRDTIALSDQTVEMLGKDRAWLESRLEAAQARIAVLAGALTDLVKINEDHNAAIEKIIGRPPGWNDSYLDAARAALKGGETNPPSEP
jgi:hypothetical protein